MSQSTQLLLSLCLLFQFFTFCLSRAAPDVSDGIAPHVDHKKNYCLRNITYYEEVAVNKTHRVEVKPTGFFKMFKKSTFKVEQYVDLEKVPRTRLVNECCEGYAMADNKTCQPICPSACPANAYCSTPHMCQCRRGYYSVRSAFMDTYYCDPRCTSGCPYGGWCSAPEVCGCAEGYRSQAGTCVPKCASGQVDCDYEVTSSTYPTLDDSTFSTSSYEVDTTNIYVDMDDDIDASSSNGELVNATDDVADADADEANVPFPSKEENSNCTLQPCIGNTICKLVDSCACADGFIRHQPAPINGTEVGPICAAVIEQGEPLHVESTDNGWIFAFFIVVGIVVMMSALAVLLLKLWRHQRGSMDVEGKNEMCCKYDKNSANSDSGHVDMI